MYFSADRPLESCRLPGTAKLFLNSRYIVESFSAASRGTGDATISDTTAIPSKI